LRDASNQAVVPPGNGNATALPVRSEGSSGATVLDHRQSVLASRRPRAGKRCLSFVSLVALPVITAAIYYFFIAADQYVAEFRFSLRSAEPGRPAASLLQESIAPSLIGSDSYIVVQYIASRAIVDDLSATVDLRQMFSRSEADWLAGLDLPVSIEDLVRYWKRQVDAFFDATNGTIVVKARHLRRRMRSSSPTISSRRRSAW